MANVKDVNEKIALLRKAAVAKTVKEFSYSQIRLLTVVLNLDKMFDNFPEEILRNYRDDYSGQPIQGRQAKRDEDGNILSCSFIPSEDATRAQLYEGFIFFIVNPAASNLAKMLFWLNVSDYAKMQIRVVAAWTDVFDALYELKKWSSYLDAVINPGELISPMLGLVNTTNLVRLDQVFFNSKLDLSERCLDDHYHDFYVFA
ncbi:hypothetical protein IKF94_01035 [Candidatus Saccharibacteria bacterium]|nr:hypothetical protein [Candidatus Saccharibacteria bacterium]